MELILLCVAVGWYVAANTCQDVTATVKGTSSPRRDERRQRAQQAHERWMAREKKRTRPTLGEALADRVLSRTRKPAKDKQRGPARSYFAHLWSDAWSLADDRRATYGQRKADGELWRQRATGRARQAWRDRRDRRSEPDAEWGPPPVDEPEDDEPLYRPRRDWWADAPHAGPTPVNDPPTDEIPVQTVPTQCERTDRPPFTPDPPPVRPAIEPARPEPVWPSNVTPIRGATMTTTTDTNGGETVDPQAALDFAQGAKALVARLLGDAEANAAAAKEQAAAAERLVGELETSISTLTEHGVQGGPITEFGGMQEDADSLAAEARAAERAFTDMHGAADTFMARAEKAADYFRQHIDAADQAQAAQQSSGMGGGRYIGVGQ